MNNFKMLTSLMVLLAAVLAGCGSSAITGDDFPEDGLSDGGASGGNDGGPGGNDGGPAGFDGGPAGFDGGPLGNDGGPVGFDGGPFGNDGGPVGFDGGPADGGPGPRVLVSISVSPAASRLVVGSSVQLTASGVFSNGSTTDVSTLVTWTTSAPGVADVGAGLVRAAAVGSATITATLNGVRGTAAIVVSPATIVSLAVTPATSATGITGTVQLHAVATLSDGTTQELGAPTVQWTSSDPRIALISASGLATGVSAGTVTLTATVAGQTVSATAQLVVNPARLVSIAVTPTNPSVGTGVRLNFHATGTYSDGSIADVTSTVDWQSSVPTTVSVAAGGLASSLAAGRAVITASTGGVSGTTTVTVTAATLTGLRVTPATASLAVRGTQAFLATGTYSDGTLVDLTRTAAWTSSADAVAAVSNAAGTQGSVLAVAPGSATITATVGNVSGTATVTVLAATLTSLAISPAAPSVPIGSTAPLTARGTYSDGSVLDVTQSVTWVSDNTTIATVSNASGSRGVVSGLVRGTTVVRASLDGQSATATLTVSGATLTSVAITPAAPALEVTEHQALQATSIYSDGSRIDITATAVWTTADPRVAIVSNALGAQGLLTAVGAGTTTVTATLGGVAGSTTVTVTAPTLSSLTVSPIAPTRALGQPVNFSATAIFSNGTQQNVTNQAVWTSSNPTVATINGGQVRTRAAGTTVITASYRGLTSTSTLTVTAAVPVSISISPITPSLAAGTSVPFQATAVMSDDTSVNVTGQATWTSSNTAVLGISTGGGGGPGGGGRGLATGIAAGTSTVTASWSGFSAATTATVTAAVAVSLVVSPATASGAVGATRQFTAQAIYSDNTSRDVTLQATWVSSAPAIVGVTTGGGGGPGGGGAPRGLATAVAVGTATLTASWSGFSATAAFTVTGATLDRIVVSPAAQSAPAGTLRQLTAQAIYTDNTSIDVTGQATWLSANSAIAAVNDAGGGPGGGGGNKGLVTALTMGSTTITASWDGKTGSASFTVTAATLATVQVTPIQPSVSVGTPLQFTATAIFSDNTSQQVTGQATWTSSAATVASVSTGAGGRGITQTLSAGTATITATYNGVSGSTVLTVTPARLLTIQLTPFAPTIPVGFTTRLAATGIYSDNTTQDLTGLATWTSNAPTVASVSTAAGSRGVLSPLSGGRATITATFEGVSGTDLVTVADVTLRSIALTPATASVARFGSQAFTAVGTFSDSSTLEVTAYVTWLSSTPSVADVSNAAGSQGVAKGLSAGSVTISAVRGTTTGTATLTVTP